ncbi:hypothetical protein [Cellulomonas chengniuliangii]|uniref:Gram-positive cocci surface proteins LPxTG domain-containing protein n=1 Tax=Cellulomonas chengniuliangii TaxID=2968084 RepID=A0ABY5KZK0_9CELL|nr:hypothetical protein [Cellulomonas chengniuliangii]MCC2309380.1 hypothetical protein [Cellulomonas chengniuliangii]UUI75054.1 hypothetical protein NP064_14945 [Cellulomonas chengniuliangii]
MTNPRLTATLGIGAVGVAAALLLAPAAQAATCLPSPGSPFVPATYEDVLVSPAVEAAPAVPAVDEVSHTEHRYARTVIDQPAAPGQDAVIREKWSISTYIKGWTKTDQVRTKIITPAWDEYTTLYWHSRQVETDPGQPYIAPTFATVVDQPAWTEEIQHPAEYTTVRHEAVTELEYEWVNIFAHWKKQWSAGDPGFGWIKTGACKTVVVTEAYDEQVLVKAAWVEKVEHPATYKEIVDNPGQEYIAPTFTTERRVSGHQDLNGKGDAGHGWTPTGETVQKLVKHHPAVTKPEYLHTQVVKEAVDPIEEVSHEETTDWLSEAPEGDGWTVVDERTVIDQEFVPAVPAVEAVDAVWEQRELTPAVPAVDPVVCAADPAAVPDPTVTYLSEVLAAPLPAAPAAAVPAAAPTVVRSEVLAATGSSAGLYAMGAVTLVALGGTLVAARRRTSED